MMKKQHYMTYPERIRLEEKLRYKVPVSQIARELGFSRQTIYNEIKRGSYQHDCGWYEERRYSADIGQQLQARAQLNKGRPLKIGRNIALANYLESKMLGVQADGTIDRRKRFSPAAALAAARAEGYQLRLSVGTLYNYITQGIFCKLTDQDLWEKPHRKIHKDNQSKVAHPKLPSIEQRPEHISQREEYGHWEMDLVVGPKDSSHVLLTLTERKRREELIFKLPNRKAATIRGVFDHLERKMPDFYQRFKSITTDNGSEFLEYEQLKKSVLGGDRFEVWYCHSYAAWEKGSNENHNRMIRRWFPKGTDFAKVPKKEIAALQDWMNGYPRKILHWRAPKDLAA